MVVRIPRSCTSCRAPAPSRRARTSRTARRQSPGALVLLGERPARCPTRRRSEPLRRSLRRTRYPSAPPGCRTSNACHLVSRPAPLLSPSAMRARSRCVASSSSNDDRKDDRRHLVPHHPVDAASRATCEPQIVKWLPRWNDRREERNALDVVPVRVREEDVARIGAPFARSMSDRPSSRMPVPASRMMSQPSSVRTSTHGVLPP